MANMEAQIKSRLAELLPSVDLDHTSERHIREKLATEFGVDMAQYAALVNDEVNRFLESMPPPAAPAPPVGSKRKAPDGAAPEASGSSPATAEGTVLQLSELKRVEVRLFKGNVQIDVREMYKDAGSGELKPGRKGLALSVDQWGALRGAMPAIDAALAAGDASYSAKLSASRRVSVSLFKDQPRVDLREWWEAEGQQLPGKKGISLQPPEWQQLRAGDGAAVQAPVEALQPKAAAPAGRADASGAAAAAGAAPAAAGSSAQQASPAAPGEDFAVSLAANRRASVRKYNGKVLVDLRETYEKDGKQLPGKKGIALSVEQFQALRSAADSLTTALEASNATASHDLGNRRKASIQVFKGTPRVSVREFYVKKGQAEELPGAKGLDMPADQWSVLCGYFGALDGEAARLAAA